MIQDYWEECGKKRSWPV